MRVGFTRGLWLLVLALLSGCAGPTLAPVVQRPAQPDAPFVFNGRVAIKHDGERSSAGLRWSHRRDEDEILLLAPLGQTVARIHRDAQGVTLDESGKHHVAQNVEALTHAVLGWELPVDGLSYWVTALPVDGTPADIRRNAYGQIAALHQDGWEINYSRYATEAADSLPLRFVLRREGLEIMVLIDEWEKQ
jgi:outer membrane lipoprotein LolB